MTKFWPRAYQVTTSPVLSAGAKSRNWTCSEPENCSGVGGVAAFDGRVERRSPLSYAIGVLLSLREPAAEACDGGRRGGPQQAGVVADHHVRIAAVGRLTCLFGGLHGGAGRHRARPRGGQQPVDELLQLRVGLRQAGGQLEVAHAEEHAVEAGDVEDLLDPIDRGTLL